MLLRFNLSCVFLLTCLCGNLAWAQSSKGPVAIAMHGGAGTILKKNMTPEREAAYRAILEEALQKGMGILKAGGTSLEAVTATIVLLEDSPLFNAGKGAVFTHEGTNELDASLMRGDDLAVGAVAGVKHIKNPIRLAQMVMEQSPHVMMVGEGAERFAKEQGMAFVDAKYFYTERRWKALERARKKKHKAAMTPDQKHGTVGVVALDQHGNLAAGTSTGGMTNKRYGRVGDSPIVGAGTYADNRSCAVSATGHGEFFIRGTIARDIAAQVAFKGLDVQRAADAVIQGKLTEMGGTGGVIVLDASGHVAFSFNTAGMYRAAIDRNGHKQISIYREP